MEKEQQKNGFCLLFYGYPLSGKGQIAERLEEQLTSGGEDVELLTSRTLQQWFHLSFSPDGWNRSSFKPLVFCIDRLSRRGVCCLLTAPLILQEQRAVLAKQLQQFHVVHVTSTLSYCRKRADQKPPTHSGVQRLEQFEQGELTRENPSSPLIQIDYEEASLDECVTELIEALARENLLDLDEGSSTSREEQVKDRLKNLGYI